MRSIRLKVKTLIIIILFAVFSVVYADEVYYQGIKLVNIFLDDDIEYAHLRSSTLDSEMSRLDEIYSQHDYELFNLAVISDGMTTASTRIRQVDAHNILETFRKYEDDVHKKGHYDYMFNVILAQWFSGNVDMTLHLLDEVPLEALDEKERDHYYLIKTGISLTYYDLEDVEKYINQISQDYETLVNYIKYYIAIIYDYEIDYEEEFKVDDDDLYCSYFDELIQGVRSFNDEPYRTVTGKPITISGHVTIDGEPVEGAMVYDKAYNGFSSFEAYSKDFVLTDSDGKYILETKDGITSYGVKLPWQLIHDKRFERDWNQTYEDGALLDISFKQGIKFKTAYFENDMFIYEIDDPDENTYFMIIRSDNPYVNYNKSYLELTEKSGKIPLNDIHQVTQSAFGSFSSNDILNIENLTEPLYLSGNYKLTLNVQSEDHIYSLNGLFTDSLDTTVYYEGVEYNQGDLLLKKGQIEEAIVWYKAHETRHNLKVLVALFTYGTEAIDGEYEQELINKDADQAIVYLNKLIELDGKTERRLNDLARLYRGLHLYDEEKLALEALLEFNQNVYMRINKGINTIMRGAYLDGIDYLLKNGDIDNEGDRYYDYFILGNQVEDLPDDIKNILISVDRSQYKDMFDQIVKGDYKEAYTLLMASPESDLKTFYQLMFLDAFNFDYMEKPYENVEDHFQAMFDFTEYYRSETEKINDYSLKAILMLIKKDNNWF